MSKLRSGIDEDRSSSRSRSNNKLQDGDSIDLGRANNGQNMSKVVQGMLKTPVLSGRSASQQEIKAPQLGLESLMRNSNYFNPGDSPENIKPQSTKIVRANQMSYQSTAGLYSSRPGQYLAPGFIGESIVGDDQQDDTKGFGDESVVVVKDLNDVLGLKEANKPEMSYHEEQNSVFGDWKSRFLSIPMKRSEIEVVTSSTINRNKADGPNQIETIEENSPDNYIDMKRPNSFTNFFEDVAKPEKVGKNEARNTGNQIRSKEENVEITDGEFTFRSKLDPRDESIALKGSDQEVVIEPRSLAKIQTEKSEASNDGAGNKGPKELETRDSRKVQANTVYKDRRSGLGLREARETRVRRAQETAGKEESHDV